MHRTLGMASANALALGDPVKLDERCSPEAHSPDLRHFRVSSSPEQNPALEVLSTPAYPQVPIRSAQGASRAQAVGRLVFSHTYTTIGKLECQTL